MYRNSEIPHKQSISKTRINCLDEIPTIQEVEKTISEINDNTSAGSYGIPPELFTHGGQTVATHLHRISVKIRIDEMIPAVNAQCTYQPF